MLASVGEVEQGADVEVYPPDNAPEPTPSPAPNPDTPAEEKADAAAIAAVKSATSALQAHAADFDATLTALTQAVDKL